MLININAHPRWRPKLQRRNRPAPAAPDELVCPGCGREHTVEEGGLECTIRMRQELLWIKREMRRLREKYLIPQKSAQQSKG